MPIKFIANHNCIIYGATNVGKTTFILNVLKQRLIHPFPKNIFYMYGVAQPFMQTWNRGSNPRITFIEGLDFSKVKSSSVLVIDDLLLDNNKEVAKTFILGSHHKKISVFFLTQNLFPRDHLFRLMSLNCHYFVLFQNPRSSGQVLTLARQSFPNEIHRVMDAYKYASANPRGFIVLTFNCLISKDLSVITDFWNEPISVYIDKRYLLVPTDQKKSEFLLIPQDKDMTTAKKVELSNKLYIKPSRLTQIH